MFNAISSYISEVVHGREISVGDKKARWTKVKNLKVGAKIAVVGAHHDAPDGVEFDEVVEIRKVGREQVYDIEVEGSRNFVGNGILAHNTYLALGNGTTPIASMSGTTSFAGLVVDNSGVGDLFTASSSGLTRFTIAQNGNVGIGAAVPAALLDVSSYFTVDSSQIVASVPTSFTAAGDVAIAYDILFTNPTASFIKSQGPLAIEAGEVFNSSNLTLQTYYKGNVVVNSEALAINGAATVSGNLRVTDSQASTASAMIENTNTGSSADGLIIKLGAATTVAAGNHFVEFQNGVGVIKGSIQGNTNAVAYVTSGIADFGEHMPSEVGPIPAGTIVCQGSAGVRPCMASASAKLVGVVSDSTGFLGGIETPESVIVGYLGQVKVRIDPASDAIKSGDSLTLGDNGLAKKATTASYIVGKALEDWSGQERLLTYVSLGFFMPEDISLKLAGLSEVKTDLDLLKDEMASVSARLAKVETVGANHDSPVLLNGSIMIDPYNADIDIATISGDLKVLGLTELAKTNIGGELQVGVLHFDDLKAEISSLTGLVTVMGDLRVAGDATVSGQLTTETGLVVKDSITGEMYCIQVTNGEIVKRKGECL